MFYEFYSKNMPREMSYFDKNNYTSWKHNNKQNILHLFSNMHIMHLLLFISCAFCFHAQIKSFLYAQRLRKHDVVRLLTFLTVESSEKFIFFHLKWEKWHHINLLTRTAAISKRITDTSSKKNNLSTLV